MKKLLFISFLLSCTTIILQAQKIQLNSNSKQIQTNKPLQPVTQQQQQPSKVNTQSRTNGTIQLAKIKTIPIPDKLHFLSSRKSLLKNEMMQRPLMQNRSTYANTSFNTRNISNNSMAVINGNSNNKNVMDNTIKKNNNPMGANNRFNDKLQKMPLTYTVIQNSSSNGPKTYFTLTDDRQNWANDFAFARKVKDSSVDKSDPKWNCANVALSFNAQSSSFMNASTNQKAISLIPGTIYSFEDYAGGNFNKEYKEGRNPIVIWTPTNVGKDSFNIQNPNGQTISQGISNIANQFSETQGGASSYQHTIYSNNQSDLNILVSAGGSYSGFSGFTKTNQNQSQHHVYVTYDEIKPLYTIIAQPPSNGYFADGKTPVTSSPLVVVQNVTYGTRILANIDIQTTANTSYDTLNLAYTDGVDNAAINFSLLANDKSLTYTGNIMVVGTGINIPIVSGQNYEQQISNLLAQGNYRTAQPIQYQLTDLDGNTLGVYSMTDQFVAKECTPATDVYTLQDGYIKFVTGPDGKNSNSQVNFSLYSNSNISKGSLKFNDNSTEFKSGNISIPYKLTNPSAPLTLDDFANGGMAEFTFSYQMTMDPFYTGDDWDITSATVTLYFVSQKGNSKIITIAMPSFRLSSHLNGTDSDLKFYFNSDGSLKGG